MNKIMEIKMKRNYLFLFSLLGFPTFLVPLIYSFCLPGEIPLLQQFILIFIIVFLIISLINDYSTTVILTNNSLIKKSLFNTKRIEIDKIKELRVIKHQRRIRIKTENSELNIGWIYERHGILKEYLIKELEKRDVLIVHVKNRLF